MFVAGVVDATLDVAPKGFGFAGIGEPKALVGLEGCMWGYSGKLERMVRGWDMPKSNGVDAKAATEFAMAGLASGLCGYS
jgi:hypothetical protein